MFPLADVSQYLIWHAFLTCLVMERGTDRLKEHATLEHDSGYTKDPYGKSTVSQNAGTYQSGVTLNRIVCSNVAGWPGVR